VCFGRLPASEEPQVVVHSETASSNNFSRPCHAILFIMASLCRLDLFLLVEGVGKDKVASESAGGWTRPAVVDVQQETEARQIGIWHVPLPDRHSTLTDRHTRTLGQPATWGAQQHQHHRVLTPEHGHKVLFG
jgi:hypothetical protein